MLSNIEQAVLALLSTNARITVPGVFAAYMRIAGHDIGDTEKAQAVATFERALDKHAVRPDVHVIEKLRNEYWYEKLGGCKDKDGDGVCYTCEHCGSMRLKDKDKDKRDGRGTAGDSATAAASQTEELPPQPRRFKQVKFGKKNKGRVCRKVRPDPYAPSTSTVRL